MWGGRSTKGRYAIPELPEVETVRRELAPWLEQQVISKAERVHAPVSPKYANLDMAVGKCITQVRRRGKFLLLPLVDAVGVSDWELVIHLGMTGVVKRVADRAGNPTDGGVVEVEGKAVNKKGVNKKGVNKVAGKVINEVIDEVIDEVGNEVVDKHVRVRLELLSPASEKSHLLFEDTRRFGRFLVVPRGDYRTLPTLHSMGLEPFDDALTGLRFWQALQGSKTAIKTHLLSQKPIAGVGNIYADEALWHVRIHPKTPAVRVSKKRAAQLLAALREVLTKSIELQGTTLRDYRTVNGEVGQFADYLHVYGKTDQPCPRCGHAITRLMIGGRSSHVCPVCQKRR